MNIQGMPPYNPPIGLNRIPTKRICYSNGFIEKDIIKLKEHTLLIAKNYPNGKLNATLFYLTDKTGKWIKSKLKYIENGMQKVTRSENKCFNG